MKKRCIRTIQAGEESIIELSYYLTMQESHAPYRYGIEIQKREKGMEAPWPLECRQVGYVSDREEEACRILERLARGTVTPCGLLETMDVILGEDGSPAENR